MLRIITLFCCFLTCFQFLAPEACSEITTTFSDGTLSGWSEYGGNPRDDPPPFAGELEITANGNPDFAMQAVDTIVGGGGLLVIGPDSFAGDLSIYSTIEWDEYVPSLNESRSTTIYLRSDDTIYRTFIVFGPLDVWNSRLQPLDAQEWEFLEGTKSFQDVLSNVTHFFFLMSTTDSVGFVESIIDNIRLVGSFNIGDVNQDHNIDLLDVQPFVDVLTSGNYQVEADCNCDGSVDLLDVAPFVDLLAGG